MKTKYFSLLIITFLVFAVTTKAQKFVTTLQHNGETQVFYGQNSLVEAYNASVKGDILNLSAGYFNAPASIEKGVQIVGSGHFPDPTGVVEKRTKILSGLNINKGADSLRLEGLYIEGDINYQAENSINYIKVIRCRLRSALFNSSSATASKNYCSFEECFISGGINFSNYGTNLLIKRSIIDGYVGYYCPYNCAFASIGNILENAEIDENVILTNESIFLGNVNSSIVQNNIIMNPLHQSCSSNLYKNNLLVQNNIDFGTNSSSNNYFGVLQSDIFISQSGNKIDYSHDYHLKNPEKYIGTDGTQVGLYGGLIPFKEKGLPSNPQITSKSIASETDVNGNLDVNITVKAQAN